jgi:hypothetical protein
MGFGYPAVRFKNKVMGKSLLVSEEDGTASDSVAWRQNP